MNRVTPVCKIQRRDQTGTAVSPILQASMNTCCPGERNALFKNEGIGSDFQQIHGAPQEHGRTQRRAAQIGCGVVAGGPGSCRIHHPIASAKLHVLSWDQLLVPASHGVIFPHPFSPHQRTRLSHCGGDNLWFNSLAHSCSSLRFLHRCTSSSQRSRCIDAVAYMVPGKGIREPFSATRHNKGAPNPAPLCLRSSQTAEAAPRMK
jgi:hypothetical protein